MPPVWWRGRVGSGLAKQENWLKITLRLPPELHRKLAEATGANSLNAEIVQRLELSLTLPPIALPPELVERMRAAPEEYRATSAGELIQTLHRLFPTAPPPMNWEQFAELAKDLSPNLAEAERDRWIADMKKRWDRRQRRASAIGKDSEK